MTEIKAGTLTQDEKKILDSGERRQFDSGAVRDIQEGKGRCDLLPIGEIARYFELCNDNAERNGLTQDDMAGILYGIDHFLFNRDESNISHSIDIFIERIFCERGKAIMELSKHYEEGAKKYADRNWEKGIPLHCYVDSGIRHLMKFYDGWQDEPHDRAFLWNMFGLLWTFHNKPELDDLPRYCPEDNAEAVKALLESDEFNSGVTE